MTVVASSSASSAECRDVTSVASRVPILRKSMTFVPRWSPRPELRCGQQCSYVVSQPGGQSHLCHLCSLAYLDLHPLSHPCSTLHSEVRGHLALFGDLAFGQHLPLDSDTEQSPSLATRPTYVATCQTSTLTALMMVGLPRVRPGQQV